MFHNTIDFWLLNFHNLRKKVMILKNTINSHADFSATVSSAVVTVTRAAVGRDNLTNVSANTASARSRIVDADMAAESAELAKSQVLQQSAMAMIAQASRAQQSILTLLQGM